MTTTSGVTSSVQTSSNGTTYIANTVSSGIDVASLITNAVNAKLVAKTAVTDQITTNTQKITAYQTLQTQTAALKSDFDALASNIAGNVFTTKQVSAATSDGTDPASILSASTTFGAVSGQYNIVVGQLATAFSASGTAQSSESTGLGYTGSFTIGEAGATAATITVAPGDTLADLRNNINATTATSGVQADILQLSSTQYELVISAQDTNKAISVSGVTGTDVLHSLGVMNSGDTSFTTVTQAAQPASITLNNATVTSDSNTFKNVLTGLNLNLLNAAPSTTVTVTVGNNVSGVTTAITNMVNDYNTLQNTIAADQKIDSDGTVDPNATLFGETLVTSLSQQLQALIPQAYGSSTSSNNLYSIGVSFNSNNNLVIDSTQLNTSLSTDFSGVQSLFASTDSTTGLADTGSALTDSYSNLITGSFNGAIQNLQTNDATLTTQADAIQTATDAYQQQLIQTYAQLEVKMQSASNLKQQVLAILNGSSGTNNNGG